MPNIMSFKSDVFLQRLVGWWFGGGLALVMSLIILADNSSTVDAYLTAYPWILYVCAAPIVSLVAVSCILLFLVVMQCLFESYHQHRSSGKTQEFALVYVLITATFLFGAIYLAIRH